MAKDKNTGLLGTAASDGLKHPPSTPKTRVIWKFPLVDWIAPRAVEMPEGAIILSLQKQGMSPTIWAVVDPEAAKVTREFVVIGTGHHFNAVGLNYIGTWQDDGFVWHLFERLSEQQQFRAALEALL